MSPQNQDARIWTQITENSVEDAVDQFSGNIERQQAELDKLLVERGLDPNKPMAFRYEFDSGSWLLREEPNGKLVSLDALELCKK